MKKILFLGFGHLGQFFLQQNKSNVIIATKRGSHQDSACSLVQYSLGEDWSYSKEFDVIIISFPAMEDYSHKLQKLLGDLKPLKHVIFISSTSVFRSGRIEESSEKNGITKNAVELIKCERIIEKLENYVIVRPGGLIDSIRHPKDFSKKMVKVTKSQTNVNLVHTLDVAAFLHHTIDQNITNEDYNLVCSDHPSKEEFYRRFNPEIEFESKDSELRIISNSKSKNTGFKYQFDNLDWCWN